MEIISNRAINFAEEFSSKIPALTLLTTLGYEFIPPSQCRAMRNDGGFLLPDF